MFDYWLAYSTHFSGGCMERGIKQNPQIRALWDSRFAGNQGFHEYIRKKSTKNSNLIIFAAISFSIFLRRHACIQFIYRHAGKFPQSTNAKYVTKRLKLCLEILLYGKFHRCFTQKLSVAETCRLNKLLHFLNV